MKRWKMSNAIGEAIQSVMTVEDYLNTVDYSAPAGYVPSAFALEFVNFIKMVNGADGEENLTPLVHYYMLDTITKGGTRIVNLCHRGIAKTTLMGEYLFLYIATYGELPGFGIVNLALYVSDSIDNGVKNMRKNLEFRWENSDFLREVVPTVRFTDIRWEFVNADGNKFIVKGYGAKALSLDTRLYSTDGYTTIGTCKVGDSIYGPDGQLAKITAKSEVFHKPMYELVLEDGRSLKVSEDHINSVLVNTAPNGKAQWEAKDLTTKELLKFGWIHTKKGNKKHKGTSSKCILKVQNTLPLVYPEKNLSVDPYTLGLILGDGSIKKNASGIVITGDKQDTDYYRKQIPYTLGRDYSDKRRPNVITFAVKGINQPIRDLGLSVHGNDKFIPEEYFFGSVEQRLALLQGLLDTDGSVFGSGRITFVSASHKLTNDVARLVRSLGGKAKIQVTKSNAFHIEIWVGINPFQLPRKAQRYIPNRRHWDNCNVVDISRIADEPSQCIAIDNESHQFLAGEYFRTHNTGVRGAKEMGRRPQLAVLDDLFSDEDAKSPTIIENVEATIYKAVTYALAPAQNMIIWSGTPFNAKDPLYKAVESGAWQVNVFPVCEKFPCSREEFRGSWPDRFTYEYVKEQYDIAVKIGKVDTFNQELMLRIMSDEDRLIRDSDIRWYSLQSVLSNKANFNFYITTDFATSERTSADYSVISVWALNSAGSWFWVDGIVERQLMDKNIDDLFRLAQIYRPQEVGIEVSGQQGGFVQWIQDQMLVRNIYFTLASENNNGNPGIRPNTQKMVRFNTVLPLFKAGKIHFPRERKDSKELREAMDELTLASKGGFKSKHDDFIDTISMLSLLNTWLPSDDITLHHNDETDIWEYEVEEESNDRLQSYLA